MTDIKKAIIIDDSLLIRKIIRNVLESMKYKIVAEASNGVEAIKKVDFYQADLLIIDVMMPKMDGLTALIEIMEKNPIKTLVVSGYDPKYLDMAFKALEYGALAFIPKNTNIGIFEKELKVQIRFSEEAKIIRRIFKESTLKPKDPAKTETEKRIVKTQHLLIIGASTGGPNIVHDVVSKLRKPFPPVIIIQHLPTGFTEAFSKRLQAKTELKVNIAEKDMRVEPNCIYIAPGGNHLVLKEDSFIKFDLYVGDTVNGVMPSLDPTILSASHIYKSQLTIAIFTGMGNDGLAGCRFAKQNKAFILTQNEESCVIYGMPKAINDEKLADYTNNPTKIITVLNQKLSG